MKYIIIFIYVIYFIVYGYSCHMTSIEPNRVIWGYICTLIFAVLSILSISIFVKYDKKKSENNQEEL
jgi:uncharacterized membrane protein (DUF485 family)